MSQNTGGLRSILSHPVIYNMCMWMLGSPKATRILVDEYIRPEKGMRILDLGCGPAGILESLPDDIDYVGVDVSEAYVEAAREKYSGRGTFHCLRVNDMIDSKLSGFDLVMGIGVLHHLGDQEAGGFFSTAAGALDAGRCLTIDPCFVKGQSVLAKAVISRDRGRCVRTPSEYADLAKEHFESVRQTVRDDMLRIPYTHTLIECRND